MKNLFKLLFRARDEPKPTDAVSAALVFYFGSSASGKPVNARTAIQMSTVYACVRVIAETVASPPFHVYEETDKGAIKAVGHPLYRIFHDEPNSEMTSFVWRETAMTHLLLYGNSYSQIIRIGKNTVVGLYPLLPDHMDVDRDSKGSLTYTYTTSDGLMRGDYKSRMEGYAIARQNGWMSTNDIRVLENNSYCRLDSRRFYPTSIRHSFASSRTHSQVWVFEHLQNPH